MNSPFVQTEQGRGAGLPQAHRNTAEGAEREAVRVAGEEARGSSGIPGISGTLTSLKGVESRVDSKTLVVEM